MTKGSELERVRMAEILCKLSFACQAGSHMPPPPPSTPYCGVTYFPHLPHQSYSGCPAKPAGRVHCPAPRQCLCPCWSGTWWPGSGGKRRWRCPQYWWTSSLGKLGGWETKGNPWWASWRKKNACFKLLPCIGHLYFFRKGQWNSVS